MKRTGRFVVAAVVALPLVASAQPPQKPSAAPGTILKTRAPVSSEVIKVHLPRPQEADLSNGLHLIVLEDHRAPVVTFQLLVDGAGGYYDPAGVTGLASFTAALMREGTTTRKSEEISQALDRLAATLNVTAGISSPFATVAGSFLSDQAGQVFSMLSDVLQHPSFPDEEIARFRTRARAQLTAQRTQPAFLARERFQRIAFGDHPASRLAATPADLDAVTRESLVSFHAAHYVPDHAVMAIAGDITLAQAREQLETALEGWKKSGTPLVALKDPPPVAGPSVTLVARPNSVQTSLLVGTQSLARTDPDYVPLTVATRVLGGPEGRLFEHLREQKGYTYGAYSSFSALRFRGAWTADTDVRTDVTEPALTDLIGEIKTMRDTPVPAKELSDQKRAIVAGFARSLESPTSMLSYYVDRYVYKLPADYWDTYTDQIDKVTAADVQRVAQKYWSPERLQIVAVGDAAKVEPALAKLGAVKKFDTEGKEIK